MVAPRYGVVISLPSMCDSMRSILPDLRLLRRVAQAITPHGDLVQDFHFVEQSNALHVLNAPSPGATASLAIGDEIVNRIAGMEGTAQHQQPVKFSHIS